MHPEANHWKELTAKRFDNIAELWRKRGVVDPERLAPVLAGLNCPPGSLILDAGCGSGNWSIALAQNGYRVRGFDLSTRMIAQAHQQIQEFGIDTQTVSLQTGDVEQIAFPTASFDGVICFNVLDFAPHPGLALTEFWRVLKPGNRLILSSLGAYSPVKRESWRRFLPDNPNLSTGNDILPWEMAALLKELGWQLLDQQPIFGPAANGTANSYTQEVADKLSDPILQQTIATAWRFVALKPAI